MKIYKNIKLSWKAIFINRARTIFAIIGISIGISAVMVMIAIGEGAKMKIEREFSKMGTNLIIINSSKADNTTTGSAQKTNRVKTLKISDAVAIENNCRSVRATMPSIDGVRKVKYEGLSTTTLVYGVSSNFPEVNNFPVKTGRFFNELENKLSKRVVILGDEVKKNLFDNENPLGKTLRIDNIPFEIIGVLIPKGASPDGANLDNKVVIPIQTAQRRVFNVNYINQIYVSVVEKEKMMEVEDNIKVLLRERHRLDKHNKDDDFLISNQLNAIKAQKESIRNFNWLILGVAIISMLVGGIGVLAVMLMSVKDRYAEIGLRLSIGARKQDIILQFVSESLLISLFGGFLGITLGFSVSIIIELFSSWETAISINLVLISTLFSMIIGLIFGILPALRASNLDPIEALNRE